MWFFNYLCCEDPLQKNLQRESKKIYGMKLFYLFIKLNKLEPLMIGQFAVYAKQPFDVAMDMMNMIGKLERESDEYWQDLFTLCLEDRKLKRYT